VAQAASWARRDWFTVFDLEPYPVCYEDLTSDPAGVTRSILNFLGLHVPGATQAIVPRHRRQADQLNQDWIARYRPTCLARFAPKTN